jgi:hypothetical protein
MDTELPGMANWQRLNRVGQIFFIRLSLFYKVDIDTTDHFRTVRAGNK